MVARVVGESPTAILPIRVIIPSTCAITLPLRAIVSLFSTLVLFVANILFVVAPIFKAIAIAVIDIADVIAVVIVSAIAVDIAVDIAILCIEVGELLAQPHWLRFTASKSSR